MVLALSIDANATRPLYIRLSQALIEAIKTGQLQSGEALPSSRVLSASLAIAPLTVHRAYQDLLSRGYVETVPGCGTFVRHRIPDEPADGEAKLSSLAQSARHANVRWSSFVQVLLDAEESLPQKPDLFAEMYQSLPTRDQLPLANWTKMLVQQSRHVDETLEYTGDGFGSIRLRQALAAYLRRARGTNCTWNQIAIFSGSQHALDILCRTMLDRGDLVAVEDPGYFGARRTFAAHGAVIVPVPVDEEGISLSVLRNLEQTPKLVHVTPSHQDPLGLVMSERRRQEIVAWARQSGALIIEDDNDCEYRHGARALPCLQGIGPDSVIYLNTFWRTLGSLTRIGYMAVPERLEQVVTFVKSIIARDFPMVEQCALADFIEEGCLERHIHKMQSVYRKRLHALTHALTVHLKGTVTLARESSGMRILARFEGNFSNQTILECAYESEFPLFDTDNFYVSVPPQGEFLIPFGQFEEKTISEAVARFAALLLASNERAH